MIFNGVVQIFVDEQIYHLKKRFFVIFYLESNLLCQHTHIFGTAIYLLFQMLKLKPYFMSVAISHKNDVVQKVDILENIHNCDLVCVKLSSSISKLYIFLIYLYIVTTYQGIYPCVAQIEENERLSRINIQFNIRIVDPVKQ